MPPTVPTSTTPTPPSAYTTVAPTYSRSSASSSESILDELWDARTGRVLFTVLVIAAVLFFFWMARDTITLFLFAVLFAYFLAPLVARLERPLHGRVRAIGVVYLVLIGVLVGIGFLAGPHLADETRSLATSIPSLLDRLGSGQLVEQVGSHYHLDFERRQQLQQFVQDHRNDILNFGKNLLAHLASPAQHLWWLILIPILSVFFLNQGQEIASEAVDMGRSRTERRTIRSLVADINVMLGSYIRAQIILSGLTLVVYTVVLSIMRVPYAVVLGPIAGFLEFIPVVGPAIGAFGIFVIAVLAGYPHAVWLILFLGTWRIIQDYVSAPRIMGHSLEINPLLQIFSVLAGGEIAGVVGALVAVPVVATLRILWRRIGNSPDTTASSVPPATPEATTTTHPLPAATTP